ncbi:hypothetical protein [Virgisporangium aurantiacum]|uniref:Uncharacterized protein n=1 Tax=Virgisporangium aurantiacum TaxID=175570 RepID=A0A8J3ZNV9_9ACTN|nr:hypothetical protein [Virgisporangium aurantiacum]GIJ64880.1 hypothetical protein Vau01_123960 [Virgisporangium aurantiacum]
MPDAQALGAFLVRLHRTLAAVVPAAADRHVVPVTDAATAAARIDRYLAVIAQRPNRDVFDRFVEAELAPAARAAGPGRRAPPGRRRRRAAVRVGNDLWHLRLHDNHGRDQDTNSCDHLFRSASALLTWWTDHRDDVVTALTGGPGSETDAAPAVRSVGPPVPGRYRS